MQRSRLVQFNSNVVLVTFQTLSGLSESGAMSAKVAPMPLLGLREQPTSDSDIADCKTAVPETPSSRDRSGNRDAYR